MNDLTGHLLGGKYEMVKRLGTGGFGEVWLAHDNLLEQSFALKVIHSQIAEDEETRRGFIKEARTMMKLKHDHIISVYHLDFDATKSLFYMVMELAQEKTLADKLKVGPLTVPECERIFSQICQAVEYAHQKKVIHLDLKPHNILFNEHNNVLVADFGLARGLEKSSVSLSKRIGTPPYMAPEQFWLDKVGVFSDIYALGLILHEMLTGKRPTKESHNRQVIIQCAESMPLKFKEVIEQATQDDREQRFSTAHALAIAFQVAIKIRDFFYRGRDYYEKKEYDLAITNYSQAINLDLKKTPMIYYERGRAYYEKKEYDLAITDYTKAIDIDPNYVDAYNGRGNAYSNKGEYDQAIADYTEAIDIDLNYVDAYNGRGKVYSKKEEYDLAIADYTEAIDIDPNYIDAYNSRGNIYYNKEEYDQAIADYTEVINIDTNYVEAYNSRGNAYCDKGEYDQAIANYTKAIDIDPNYVKAYNGRGNAYCDKGEYDQAIADYTEAINLDPNHVNAYNGRGTIYYNREEYNQAVADYTEAIRLDPSYEYAYYNRGLVYKVQGQKDKAIADFRKAVALNNDPDAMAQLRELGIEP